MQRRPCAGGREDVVNLIECTAYLAVIGAGSFVLGRMIPLRWLNEERFPFHSFRFEREGSLYDRIGIKRWQGKLPDMSRILPGAMPSKKLGANPASRLPIMVKETCVAELVHGLLCLAGLYCIALWPGPGGATVSVLYAAGNIPFILAQRCNRPRLARLGRKRQAALAKRASEVQA